MHPSWRFVFVAAAVSALTAGAALPVTAKAQARRAAAAPGGLDLYVPIPPGARVGPDVVALGRRLFFDADLSRDSTLACASCHQPERGFADSRKVSVGVFGRTGTRNVPAILNLTWGKTFFWDGRTATLEQQVLQPLVARNEMDVTVDDVVQRLRQNVDYRRLFDRTLGEDVTRDGLARALAAYVRSIRAGGSRFDRFADGDRDALNALERRGLNLFQGRARCTRCHLGALLTDLAFHNTGVAWRSGEPADSGRALVTGQAVDVGAFKTPTLRHVSRTAPYMRDGSLATLEEVVDFYDEGGHANPYLDQRLRPLGLTDRDKAALLAFLRSLEGHIQEGGPLGV